MTNCTIYPYAYTTWYIYNPLPLSTLPWLSNQLNDMVLESRQGQVTLIFSGTRPKPTQRPVKWAPGLFPRLSRPQREVNRSPPSSVEVQDEWIYTPTPPIRLKGVDRENGTFRLTAWFTAVTRSWTEWLRNRGSIAGEKTFVSSPPHPDWLYNTTGGSFTGWKRPGRGANNSASRSTLLGVMAPPTRTSLFGWV
jgi:hypothetical protein